MFKLLIFANQKLRIQFLNSFFWGGAKLFQVLTKDGDGKFISCPFFLYKLTATVIIPLSIIKYRY